MFAVFVGFVRSEKIGGYLGNSLILLKELSLSWLKHHTMKA